jgi:bifunctional ADP-heptose synthase (sugar kinase/adenylyltransferase)
LVGDLFLDRYLDLDDALTEPSLETGLPAYQVSRVRAYPGALGTVMNNLVALGVGSIVPVTMIGDDGEGYELLQALRKMPTIHLSQLVQQPKRRTPTYTKPMLSSPSASSRELSRIDIKNREPIPAETESELIDRLKKLFPLIDALLVLDQVSEPECGVITTRMRELVSELARANPEKFILADSRERIQQFRDLCVKPNEREYHLGSAQWNRSIFATRGENGIVLTQPGQSEQQIPAYPVKGPIDIVGAGDSCSAGIACGVVAGLSFPEAAAFGNLIASITIQQIGTTGSATPQQVRERWVHLSEGR